MHLKKVNIVKPNMNIKMEFNVKPKLIIFSKVLSVDIYDFISKLSWPMKLNGLWVEKIDFQKVSHKFRTQSHSNKRLLNS